MANEYLFYESPKHATQSSCMRSTYAVVRYQLCIEKVQQANEPGQDSQKGLY